MLKYGVFDLWVAVSEINIARTNKVFHLRVHSRPEHAFSETTKVATKTDVTWMSQGHNFFPQRIGVVLFGNKQTRATENQVSLNNQFPTELEEGTEGWIAIANNVWPLIQDDLPERFTDQILEGFFLNQCQTIWRNMQGLDVFHKLKTGACEIAVLISFHAFSFESDQIHSAFFTVSWRSGWDISDRRGRNLAKYWTVPLKRSKLLTSVGHDISSAVRTLSGELSSPIELYSDLSTGLLPSTVEVSLLQA